MSEVERYTPTHSERFKENEKCMSQFKNIEKLGLEIIAPYRASGTEMVRAEDLEDLLQSAQVVYEVENSAGINSW